MGAMGSAGSGGDAGDNEWAMKQTAGMLKMVMVRTKDEVQAREAYLTRVLIYPPSDELLKSKHRYWMMSVK